MKCKFFKKSLYVLNFVWLKVETHLDLIEATTILFYFILICQATTIGKDIFNYKNICCKLRIRRLVVQGTYLCFEMGSSHPFLITGCLDQFAHTSTNPGDHKPIVYK